MTHKPPQSLTAWPTSSAANFSKLPQDRRVKMIRIPEVYYATHDTMPPSTQGGVGTVLPTLSIASDHRQATDAKVSGKRDGPGETVNPRPRKQYRP
uniref:DET1- and DDB1-associated protein 1 domain-containing protein n=1 Tax=Peronospora matthiolae TaxID=2874970 RepID=A0AAV1VP92_9STRA